MIPPAKAVSVTAWDVVTVDVAAVKLTDVAPAGTVTEPGTATAALLLKRETASPPEVAASVRSTVHVSVPDPVTELATQLNESRTPVSAFPVLPDEFAAVGDANPQPEIIRVTHPTNKADKRRHQPCGLCRKP